MIATLLKNRAVTGAAAAALVLGAALLERQCTVLALEDELAGARASMTTCSEQKGALAVANEQLAASVRRQAEAVQEFAAEADRRQGESRAALRAAQQEADEQRAAAQWIAGMLGRKAEVVKPGECEAAAAVRLVREALR